MHMYCQCKFHLQILFRKTVDIVNISLLFREKRYDFKFVFFAVESLVIFLKYIFEFVFNTARSA